MNDDSEWKQPESIWEIRRKAPFHFLAKADNARMSAYALSHIEGDFGSQLASDAGYNGALSIALGEAFRREASISLELILKAILCVKRKSAPPSTHDIYQLWSDADLPKLQDDDLHRLAEMTEILYWSGRYAAPNSDKNTIKADARFKKHQKTKAIGKKLKVIEPTPLGWEEFIALYNIAAQQFWDLDPNDPKNFVA
ncbi:HEPN domain-containing protein [Litoreibacter albidus]|uniref:HEPN domain-containing protein n=1 Tax=Litoreibacter albidus TaxID=670155 RepID=UPI003736A531